MKNTNERGNVVALITIVLAFVLVKGVFWYRDNHYPQTFEDNFTTSCVTAGATPTACSCALNYVEDHYTYKQALDMEASGNYSGAEAGITSQCV